MKRSSTSILLVSGSLLLLWAQTVQADTLKITSTPDGATVEIDGVKVGTTPFEAQFPGGYFHKNLLGARLEHSMTLRVRKEGFTSKEIEMTEGAIPCVRYNMPAGAYRAECWLLKTNHFDVALEPLSKSFTGTVVATTAGNLKTEMRPELPVEDIVQQSKPAVVALKRPDGQGTGFFITETGVIATNAHVARGEDTLIVE